MVKAVIQAVAEYTACLLFLEAWGSMVTIMLLCFKSFFLKSFYLAALGLVARVCDFSVWMPPVAWDLWPPEHMPRIVCRLVSSSARESSWTRIVLTSALQVILAHQPLGSPKSLENLTLPML